jgi:hypothetical protein
LGSQPQLVNRLPVTICSPGVMPWDPVGLRGPFGVAGDVGEVAKRLLRWALDVHG